MESLKPLKIVGALALLCLAIYLAFPNGRLNFAAYFRIIKNPLMQIDRGLTGPNAQVIRESTDKSVALGYGTKDPYFKATRFVETALKSDDIRVIGFAARMACSSLPSVERDYQPNNDESNSQRKYLTALTELNEKGRTLNPENSFFALQLACISMAKSQSTNAKSLLADAAQCPEYNDFIKEEVDLRMESIAYTPSRYEYYMRQSVVTFYQFAPFRNLIKGLIADNPPNENIDIRLNVTQIGIKLATSDYLINQSVGRSYIQIAQQSHVVDPGKAAYMWEKGLEYTPTELEAAALLAGIKSDGLFIRADKAAEKKVNVAGIVERDWVMWINLSRGILTLIPYFIVSIPLLVAGILLSSKMANKPWLKSIRYLAIVPLTMPFTPPGPISQVQDAIVLTVICISIPVALIIYTERFIPVIHIALVAIAIYLFERDNVISVTIIAATSSIITLLAWYKNRNEETKPAKIISVLMTIGFIFSFGVVATYHLIDQNFAFTVFEPRSINLFDANTLIIFLLATLGIASPDKMKARFQATIIASIGLVCLILSCYFDLRAPAEIDRFWASEKAIATRHRQEFLADLNAPLPANNPTTPDVKLKSK